MKKTLIGIVIACSLTNVYADDTQKLMAGDQATSKNQKNVCIYAGLAYSEGAFIQVGKVTQVCSKPDTLIANADLNLVWLPVPPVRVRPFEK